MEHQIKNAKYEGYLWQSDQSKPRIIEEGEPLSLTLTDGENPFVVEGLLWNPEENTSIQIRYVDGNYFVTTYEVKQEELDGSATTTPVTNLPHHHDRYHMNSIHQSSLLHQFYLLLIVSNGVLSRCSITS